MREMKDSGVEWIGEIPREWSINRIKFVATFNDEVLKESCNPDMEIEYVEIGSVSLENGIESTDKMLFKDAPSRARRVARRGDIIISTVRTYLKAIALIEAEKYVVSTGFCVIRPNKIVDNKFLKYFLSSELFTERVSACSVGISYPAINATTLVNFHILCPPLHVQREIVESLDKKCAQVDALITNVQTQIKKLKEYKQSLITEVVTKGLDPNVPMKDSGVEWIGEIPEYYYSIQLKRLAEIVRGGSPRPAGDDRYYDGDIPFMKISDITKDDGIYVDSCVHTIKPAGLSSTRKIDAGTLLLTNSGATLGVPKINTFSTTFNDGIAAFLNISESIDILFAYYSLKSRTKLFLEEASMGMGQPNLNTDIIGNTYIVLPPREEQQRIVEFLNAKCAQIDKLISLKQSKIEKLEQYKKSLIYEYVTGKKEAE